MTSRQRLLLKLLVPAATMLVAVGCLEAAARVYARVTHQPRGMRFDLTLGWRPLPNVFKQGDIWGVSRPARTNADGWRDRDHPPAPAPGVRRVAAVGDSFTFGVGVDDGERFTDVIERTLSGVEILNFGVPGFGTDQEVLTVETQVLNYAPSVLVLTAYAGNDLDDIRYRTLYSWPKPYFTIVSERLDLHPPAATPLVRLRSASYLVEFFYQRLVDADAQGAFAPEWVDRDGAPLFARLIARLQTLTRAHGVDLVVVVAHGPDDLGATQSAASRAIVAALADLNVRTLDTRTLFAAEPGGGADLFAADAVHWNARGHALVARALAPLLSPHATPAAGPENPRR